MFLIDLQNKTAMPLEKKKFGEMNLSERYDLQEWIVDHPSILGEPLLIIQKEFSGFGDTKERLDLLALDKNGNLVIIENKLDDSGKDVTWQALKYVSYCATLKKAEICKIYEEYLNGKSLAQDMLLDFFEEQDFENIRLNPLDGDQRMIFVAAKFRKEVTSTVLWLQEHGIDITCIKVTPYQHDNNLYLNAEQILPIQDIGDYQIRLAAKKQEDIGLSEAEETRSKLTLRFWENALPVLRNKTGLFNNVSPSKDSWLNGSSGYSGIQYNPIILNNAARAEMYIDTGDQAKNELIYQRLFDQKNEINSILGEKVVWRDLPKTKRHASRIFFFYKDSGLLDEEHWDNVIGFLGDSISVLIKVFNPLLIDAIKE